MTQENFMMEVCEMPAIGIMLDTYKSMQCLKVSGFNERQSEAIVDLAQRCIYLNCVNKNVGTATFNKFVSVGFSEKQAEALIELVKEAGVIQSRRDI